VTLAACERFIFTIDFGCLSATDTTDVCCKFAACQHPCNWYKAYHSWESNLRSEQGRLVCSRRGFMPFTRLAIAYVNVEH
jgi:hypothetical protein